MNIFEKIIERKKEIEKELSSPETLKDKNRFYKLTQEYKKIEKQAKIAEKILETEKEIKDIEEMLKEEKEEEMLSYLRSEKEKKEKERKKLFYEFINLEKEDFGKNCILEIRAGTGGEEAALFARDLLRMYIKFAEKNNFKVSITDIRESELGGVREAVVLIEGKNAYKFFRFESGVHRVQRVPVTETGGRIHTSTASVAVLPEFEDVEVDIKEEDLEIETKRAGGPGGQHVNVTDSAVRITHKPTGIVVQCQDERSQHRNREKALRILKARLYEYYKKQKEEELKTLRKEQIGTQERSEKIRTYNFMQNRVTDHRIPLTLYNLEEVLEGNIEPFIEKLEEKELENIA